MYFGGKGECSVLSPRMNSRTMDSLRVPHEGYNGAASHTESDIAIVIENVDECDSDGVPDTNGDLTNDFTIDDLTKEDFGLKEEDDDEMYDGLISDFRNKMDSLSFRRLDRKTMKAQAASFRAQRQKNKEDSGSSEQPKFVSRKKDNIAMLPAVKFQDLDDDETYRRDTGSSYDRSRASSGASSASRSRKFKSRGKSQFQGARRKSVMGALMKRGRTVRKTLRAMHINEADHHDGEGYGLPPTNEQRLRMFVLKEILDTEADYLKLLQFMVEVMTPSLQKMAEDPTRAHSCTPKTVSQILSNVREIHELHVSFHETLHDVMAPAPYHTHCIGKVFLQFKDKFQVYDEYCSNFSRAQKVCYELEKDPDFCNLIDEWKNGIESQSRRFLHLEGFIISPVQRLCKYPLLLRELKKYTSSHHKDHKDVAEAQQVMEDVTQSVNESERRKLMVQAIKDMENLCDSWEQSGFVSKQGFLTKRGGSVKSWYIRWFLLRGYQLAYYNEPTDVRPLGVLDLTSYKSFDPDASHVGRPFAFGIKMPDRTYYMYSTSEEERQEWINILQWKFDCIERSRRQAHHPFETVVFSSLSSFLHPKSTRSVADDDGNGDVIDYSGNVINTGPTILEPMGEEDEEEVFSNNESEKSDSLEKFTGQRSKSQSLTVLSTGDVTKTGNKARATSYRPNRTVTSTIQKSPTKTKRISGLFVSKRGSKSTGSIAKM